MFYSKSTFVLRTYHNTMTMILDYSVRLIFSYLFDTVSITLIRPKCRMYYQHIQAYYIVNLGQALSLIPLMIYSLNNSVANDALMLGCSVPCIVKVMFQVNGIIIVPSYRSI